MKKNSSDENMKDKEMWVVTRPTLNSEMADICYKSSIKNLMLQTMGGLKFEEIVAVYDNEKRAVGLAVTLLQKSNELEHEIAKAGNE